MLKVKVIVKTPKAMDLAARVKEKASLWVRAKGSENVATANIKAKEKGARKVTMVNPKIKVKALEKESLKIKGLQKAIKEKLNPRLPVSLKVVENQKDSPLSTAGICCRSFAF